LDRDINAAINIRNLGLGTSPAITQVISEATSLVLAVVHVDNIWVIFGNVLGDNGMI
jgi:hypothetical protein